MIHARRTLLGLTCAAATLTVLPAGAQERSFYLDRIQISGAPDDGYTVWRPRAHDETRFYGSLTLGYTLNPLRDENVTSDGQYLRNIRNPVTNQVISYLMAGTEIAGRVGVNVALPIGLFMAGRDPAEDYPQAGINAPLTTAALHDLRFDARVPIYTSNNDKFAFGVGAAMWAPTGNADSFAGDDQATAMLYLNAEYDFGKFWINGMAGPHLRPDRSLTNSELAVGSEIRWAFGAFMPLRDQKIRLGVELWGTTGVGTQDPTGDAGDSYQTFFAGRNTDLEWLAQGRFALGEKERTWANLGGGTRLLVGYGAPDVRLLASIGYWFPIKDREPKSPPRAWRPPPDVEDKESDRDGDGYPDNVDKCPDIPEDGKEPEPSDGCPAGADRDGDGIPDEMDKCPDTPEDKDGIEDEDGCPEKDADNDTIPDSKDACPTEPGPASDIAEKHGCPSLTRIDEASGEIALLEPIQFEYNSAKIKQVSYPILDEVVGVMKARGNLRIGVYGHTDSRGSDDYNLRLSKARAKSVMRYLIDKGGIAQGRLESEGYGESRPKCNEENEQCWTINRRVEFKMMN